jgi:predicted nucleic acid-binding protein
MVRDLRSLPITETSHLALVSRMWELRHSITAYDAAYVALAEHLDVPLITCDGKLARSHGHNAKIELYPVS